MDISGGFSINCNLVGLNTRLRVQISVVLLIFFLVCVGFFLVFSVERLNFEQRAAWVEELFFGNKCRPATWIFRSTLCASGPPLRCTSWVRP